MISIRIQNSGAAGFLTFRFSYNYQYACTNLFCPMNDLCTRVHVKNENLGTKIKHIPMWIKCHFIFHQTIILS